MQAEIAIHGSAGPETRYVAWAPVPAQVRLTNILPADVAGPVQVTLRNQNTQQGGQIVFGTSVAATTEDSLSLTLPFDGTPVDLLIGGKFGRASTADGDAAIEVVVDGSGQVLSTTTLMVRIRKNAATLTTDERDRFLAAIATFNDRGMGRFSDFRNVHSQAGSPEAHGNAGFPPWHRAFVLDLERELQAIDPSVAMPYWRFDEPAPTLFVRAFMGVPNPATGTLQFSVDNPLQFWATDGITGIVRRPQFNPQSGSAFCMNEADTLALGGAVNPAYEPFRDMENDPHGSAHVSFSGSISSIPTAAKDPLFFMLHNNVDRLWAKWQWFNRRFDATVIETYSQPGAAGSPGSVRIGHNLDDTMWPWNGVTGAPRPPTAPGGDFPPSLLTDAPGLTPTVATMIDYQGVVDPGNRLGFDYDDVPFEA